MKQLTITAFLLSSIMVGAQWELVTPIKTRSEFPAMRLLSDHLGYALDRPLGAILRTGDGGASWERLANNISSQPRALFMWDELRGIVVAGAGTIIRTSDGFNTTSTTLEPTYGNLTCVFFVNDTLGWIGTESGKIYRSTDAGETWSLTASGQPNTNYLTAIQFVDAQIGYASCYAGNMLKSIDGGLTWQAVGPFDQVVLIQDIHFFDAETGVGVGNAGEVIRTTDGGTTWDSIPTNCTYSMRDLDAQGSTLIACGDQGRTMRSTDAGLTWAVVQAGIADHQSISLTPNGIALLGTDGGIQRSSDFGATWEVLVQGTWHTRINKVSFMDADTGVAIGWETTGGFEDGLLRTIDGGRHWRKAGAGGLGVRLTDDGSGCLGGGGGAFARTADGFGTRTSASGPNMAIRCTWSFNGNTHLAGGGAVNGGIYRTTTGGNAWTHVLDIGNITISDLWFANDTLGFAVGEYGDGYRTTDGGLTWESNANGGGHTAFFLNELLGWTKNFRTTDGGDTWIPMYGTPQNTMSIFFTDPDTGYAVNYTAQTVRSVDGGVTWASFLPDILNASVGDAAWVDGAIVIGCNNGDIFRAQVSCPVNAFAPTITQVGGSLCVSTTGTAQWYLDGDALLDANTPCFTPTASGYYHVIVTDELGCVSAPSAAIQVISTGMAPAGAAAVRVHPNPATDLVPFERKEASPVLLTFLDAQGRVVRTEQRVGNSLLVDVSGLFPGMYLVRISSVDDTGTARFVKE